jgi:hypothetical protein
MPVPFHLPADLTKNGDALAPAVLCRPVRTGISGAVGPC